MATSSRKKSVTMSKNIIIRPDPDTSAKVQSAIRLLSETMQINANEPSLAFYRIQEHIRKTYPAIVQKQRELENLQVQIDGLVFDIEYSMEAVKTILNSECHFSNIQTQLQKAILLQKQIHLLNQQQIQQKLFGKRDEKLLHKNQTVKRYADIINEKFKSPFHTGKKSEITIMPVTNQMRKVGIISTTATIAAISLAYAFYLFYYRRSRSQSINRKNLQHQNRVSSEYERPESQDVWENADDTLTKELIHTPEQLYKHGLEHLNIAIDYWNRALNYIDNIAPSIKNQPDLLLQTDKEITNLNTNFLLTSLNKTNHFELKQKLQFLLSKVDVSSDGPDLLFLATDKRTKSPPLLSPTTSSPTLNRQESIRQQQQTALNVQNDLNTFNERRSLCSIRSIDSFESCADDAEWLETSDILFDPSSPYYSMPAYYVYGLRLAEKNQVPYKKLRTKLLTCSSDTDYLAKLFCIRNACDEVLSGDEKREYIKTIARAICEKFLEKSSKDSTRFLQAFEQMNALMADPSNTSMIMEEMASAGIKSATVYNVGIDFMLLEGFEILDSPPSAMKTILQNKWFSENFREQALNKAVSYALRVRRATVKYNNGFLTTFLSLIEDMSPVFAWGILGPPSKVKPMCTFIKDSVLDFARSLYDLKRTDYSSLQTLVQSIDKQLQDLLTRLVLEMGVNQNLLIQPIQNEATNGVNFI